MKAIKIVQSVIVTSLFISVTGCTCCIANDAEDNYTLGSALTKLSAAVEATVQYDEPPPGLNGLELLQYSTKHDPKLLEPFSGYLLKTLVKNGHAAVLVCDKSGEYAKLEDAGCTSQLDKHPWKEQPQQSCNFSLNLEEICQE